MLLIKDNLTTFSLDSYIISLGVEYFCIELKLRNKKWLIYCCHNPHIRVLKNYLAKIEKAINDYTSLWKCYNRRFQCRD